MEFKVYFFLIEMDLNFLGKNYFIILFGGQRKLMLMYIVHSQWSGCFETVVQKYWELDLHFMFPDEQ